MCDVCHQHPCDPKCPNAPEPKIFAYCDECNGEIYEGEMYVSIAGKTYCGFCIGQNTHTAEPEDQ